MSDSLMAFQPAIDEPSNIVPSSKMSSSIMVWSKVTCCSLPRMSVKRTIDVLDVLVLDLLEDVGCRWSSVFPV